MVSQEVGQEKLRGSTECLGTTEDATISMLNSQRKEQKQRVGGPG